MLNIREEIMKIFVLIVALLVSTTSYAGLLEFWENTNKLEKEAPPIEFILDVQGKTQGQIYSTAKSWIGESHVVEINDADKDSGRIVGVGIREFYDHQIYFTLRIDTKDNKIKMTFTNFQFLQNGYANPRGIYSKGDLIKATEIAKKRTDEFLEYANKQAVSDKW